jgi:transcriptional regulator, propionate catabolism operon regulatory protein
MSETQGNTKPKIWAVGISKLRELYREIASEYDDVADLRIVEDGFEGVLTAIDNAGIDRPDGIISAGANGAYIKARTNVPVALVTPTGFDVMHALSKARRESQSIALVMHGDTPQEVRRFFSTFSIDVTTVAYSTTQEAEHVVLDLRDAGFETIVGPGLVTELAEQAGMRSVFLYSTSSVQRAFDNAFDMLMSRKTENQWHRKLDRVINQLSDGVIALDRFNRVEVINRTASDLLGIASSTAINERIDELSPELFRAIPEGPQEEKRYIFGKPYLIRRSASALNALNTVVTLREAAPTVRAGRASHRQHSPHQPARYCIDDLIGESRSILKVKERVEEYAASDATALITGESGSGKEIVAQSIHNLSPRSKAGFVAVNCGALSETLLESELFGYEDGAFTGARRGGKTGLIEAAHLGTLFLDEIAEMPYTLQNRLLRVIQEREVIRVGSSEPVKVDIRIIAATHHPLREHVEAGRFRADLYYRLNVVAIAIAPLRDRIADVPLIAEHLLRAKKPSWDSSHIDLALKQIRPALLA